MNNQDNNIKVSTDSKEQDTKHKNDRDFFLASSVKERKDYRLKERLKSLIRAKGMSEPDFFHRLQMSRQLWYFYSWGIWETPIHVKVKIAKELDTDSSAIFLKEEEENESN